MRLKPIEYIWLCARHYSDWCEREDRLIPVLLIMNSFGWKCYECEKDGVHMIIVGNISKK